MQGAAEKITVAEALYAITLGAAYTLQLDHEVGSIEVGKHADFAVLEADPSAVEDARLKDIGVWGTVQGGGGFFQSPRCDKSSETQVYWGAAYFTRHGDRRLSGGW